MPSGVTTYTPSNRLPLQFTGANTDIWGTILNGAMQRIEDAKDGVLTLSVSSSATLTTANDATDQAHYAVLNVATGTGGYLNCPAVEKVYVVAVASAVTGAVTMSAGGVTCNVYPGETTLVFCDGLNFARLQGLHEAPLPSSPTDLATRAYVDAAAFAQTSLPALAGNQGGFIKDLDGQNAGWALIQQSDVQGLTARLTADEAAVTALNTNVANQLSSNLSTVNTTISTAVANLQASNAATVGLLTPQVQGLTTDVADMSFILANGEAALLGFPDGFTDAYADETGVDTANSNAIFAQKGLFKNLPAGAAWTPAYLSGSPIVAWFDASVPSSLSLSSGTVYGWTSLRGNSSFSANTTSPDTPPTYDAGAHPAVDFGSSGYGSMNMSGVAAIPTLNMSLAVQVNLEGAAAAYPASLLNIGTSTSGPANGWALEYSAANTVELVLPGTSTSVSFSKGCIYGAVNAAGTVPTINANGGTPIAGATGSSAASGVAPSFGVLGYWAGYSQRPPASVNEVLIFNRMLTTSERQLLEGYLAWKWGTQAQLPSSHPYYSAAPQGTSAPAVLQSLAPVTLTQGTPSAGYLYTVAKLGSGAAINTDLAGALSRDGATFTSGTFTPLFTRSDGYTLYRAGPIDLTSQPTGATPKYKLSMTNKAEIDLAGSIVREA